MEYHGHEIKFIGINHETNTASFTIDGVQIEMKLECEFSPDCTHYIFGDDDYEYSNVGFKITDGIAVSTSYDSDEEHAGKTITCKFDTIENILTNQDAFDVATYYSRDIGENPIEVLKENASTVNIGFFFQGFFFSDQMDITIE